MKKTLLFLLIIIWFAGVGAIMPLTTEAKEVNVKKSAIKKVQTVKPTRKTKSVKKSSARLAPINSKHWWARLPASGKRTTLLSPKQRRLAEEREATEEARNRQILATLGIGLPGAIPSSSTLESSQVNTDVSSDNLPGT